MIRHGWNGRRGRPSHLAFSSAALILAAACASAAGPRHRVTPDTSYVVFRNATEDQVRVFFYEGDRAWPIGEVQAFRSARLAVPADLTMRRGITVTLAAVPVGGRGLTGDPATGAIVRSDAELIDHVTEFSWTLAGHTLAAEPALRHP